MLDRFEKAHAPSLSGTLAAILHEGGAYDRVKDAAEPFARHLLGEEHTDTAVYTSHAPWSSFFNDIAWDHTWVIYRPDLRLVHCIAATDTDQVDGGCRSQRPLVATERTFEVHAD